MTPAQRIAVAIAGELEPDAARNLGAHLADLDRRRDGPGEASGPWDGRALELLAQAGQELVHLLEATP